MPLVKDLVCGAQIDTDAVDGTVGQTSSGAARSDPSKGTKRLHEGTWYYFDTLACRTKFMAAPEKYL